MQVDRRDALRLLGAGVGGSALSGGFGEAFAAEGTAAPRFPRNAEEFDQMFRQTKNWGRWGKDDQLGALNLITAEKKTEAAALVRTGLSVSFSHGVKGEPAIDNRSPFEHTMKKAWGATPTRRAITARTSRISMPCAIACTRTCTITVSLLRTPTRRQAARSLASKFSRTVW